MPSLPILLKIAVKVSSEGITHGPIIPTHHFERDVKLPEAIIPNEFELPHCLLFLDDGTVKTLMIDIEVSHTRYHERSNCYIVFGKVLEWTEHNFQHAIATMEKFGWRIQQL